MSYQNTNNKDILKYNILFLMNGAKPPRGGEFLTLYLITHLRKDMFYPIVIYAEEGSLVKEVKKAGIETIHIPLSRNLTNIYPRQIKLYSPTFLFAFLRGLIGSGCILKLNKLLKGKNIQIIYCADNLSKFIGGITGKMANIKVVAPCHDDFKEDSLGRIMRLWYLLFLDKVLAVSEKVRKFFTVKGEISPKVITVYNGIDSGLFDPDIVADDIREEIGLRKDSFVIGSIGALEKGKGHQYLFEAIARLKTEGLTNIVCIVCGTGPEKTNLERLIEAKGLRENVLLLGYRKDIPRILRTLNLLVVASITIEACSMTIIEAQAMKVPVIATNISGNPELVSDNITGLLVPPGDVDALCNAIKYLVKNPEVRIKMGENARARILEHFTIEKNVRKTEEVFLEMLRGI